MLTHTRKLSLIVAALSVLVLSACGGGSNLMKNINGNTGNVGDNRPGGGSPEGPTLTTRNFTTPTPATMDIIARAIPTAGSVTQGSNVEAGVTTDRVSIRFMPDDPGVRTHVLPHHPIATIRTGDGRTLESNDDPTRMRVVFPSSGEVHYINPARDYRDDIDDLGLSNESFTWFPQNIEFLEDSSLKNYLDHPKQGRRIDRLFLTDGDDGVFIENEDGSIVDVTGSPRGMAVHGFTDYPSSQGSEDATDYLSWGWWIYYQANTLSDFDFSYGVFADGLETAFSDVPVTGTASYSGYSSGIALKGGDQSSLDDYVENTFEFVAEANLTANFTEGSAVVTGIVNNFKGSNSSEASPAIIAEALANDGFLSDLTITLGRANLGEENSHSFFQGDASATGGLTGAMGKWGGQFFGTPSAGQAPPAVGGTWGVTQGTGPNDWKIVGGYGAWKSP